MKEIKLKIEDHNLIDEFINHLARNGYKVWRSSPERKMAKPSEYFVHFEVKEGEVK